MNIQIVDGSLIASFDSAITTKTALLKCMYWYTNQYYVSIKQANSEYQVIVKPQNADISEDEFKLLRLKLQRDVIDFTLREIVCQETQNVRDLLVAKAFSNNDLDEDPPGNISDPVGFNPYSLEGNS